MAKTKEEKQAAAQNQKDLRSFLAQIKGEVNKDGLSLSAALNKLGLGQSATGTGTGGTGGGTGGSGTGTGGTGAGGGTDTTGTGAGTGTGAPKPDTAAAPGFKWTWQVIAGLAVGGAALLYLFFGRKKKA